MYSWNFDILQNRPCQSNRTDLIFIGIREVNLRALSTLECVEMTRLHDHAPKSKNIPPAFVGGVNADFFGAETNHRGLVSQGFCSLGVDMLEINSRVIGFWVASTIKGHLPV